MTWYGVTGDRYDRNGHPYMAVGTYETEDYAAAMSRAYRYASSHPSAAAHILRDGDPYLWVHHRYDLGKNEDTVYLKDCVTGHQEIRVNGRTVSDTRNHTMPSVNGVDIGEV